MKFQTFRWVLAACVFFPTSSGLAAQSSTQSSEYPALLKRIEVFEKRNNERQPPDKVMDAIGLTAGNGHRRGGRRPGPLHHASGPQGGRYGEGLRQRHRR